jgi:hypothetical protein
MRAGSWCVSLACGVAVVAGSAPGAAPSLWAETARPALPVADLPGLSESIPLPGSVDEIVVDERPALEVFLSPSDFPETVLRYVMAGPGAEFALDIDLSRCRGTARPTRVTWPTLGNRPLDVSAHSQGLPLTPLLSGRSQGCEDVTFTSTAPRLEWYLRPEAPEAVGPLPGRVVAVRLVADDGSPLMEWRAPAAPPPCRPSPPAGLARCRVPGVSPAVGGTSVHPSGDLLALAGGDLRPRVDVYDRATWNVAWRVVLPPWEGSPMAVAFAAPFNALVVVDGTGKTHVWSASTGGEHRQFGGAAVAAALVAGQGQLVTGDRAGRLTLWSLADGTVTASRELEGRRPWSQLLASGNGWRFAGIHHGAEGTAVTVWDVARFRPVGQLPPSGQIAVSLAFDEAGERLFAIVENAGLLSWSVDDEPSRWTPLGGDQARRCRDSLATTADGELLACAVPEGVALFWLPSGRYWRIVRSQPAPRSGRSEAVGHLFFSPAGDRLFGLVSGALLEWVLPRRGP